MRQRRATPRVFHSLAISAAAVLSPSLVSLSLFLFFFFGFGARAGGGQALARSSVALPPLAPLALAIALPPHPTCQVLCEKMATAASSPVHNNSSGSNVPSVAPPTPNGSITPPRSSSFEMPKQSLRGIKKPKCIKCGNIARSRCPFQSCKSCCAKAQNPCHIHVLKLNGTLPDKPPTAASPLPEQPTNDTSSSLSGAAMRLSSLRQLSSAFINSLRTRKPLSQKDAENINKWRFAKLKEHIEGNIEVENEAFDRYIQNVSLLEETFSSNFWKHSMPIEACSSEDDFSRLVSGIRVRLKSNPERTNSFQERIQEIMNKGLEKLKKLECHGDLDSFEEFKRQRKILKSQFERTAAVDDLIDKLIRARSEDDLKSCLETKLQLFNQEGCLADCKSSYRIADTMVAKDSSHIVTAAFSYSLPKLFTTVQISEDSLSNIDEEFCSLSQIAEL